MVHGIWGESQIAVTCTLQSAEAFGCTGIWPVWFQNSVTVWRRLFKYSLGTCQIHVKIMHMNS